MQIDNIEDKIKELSAKFDFFRRIEGRLNVQINRANQLSKYIKDIEENKNCKRLKNLKYYKAKFNEIQICISEIKFIRNNILDEYYSSPKNQNFN